LIWGERQLILVLQSAGEDRFLGFFIEMFPSFNACSSKYLGSNIARRVKMRSLGSMLTPVKTVLSVISTIACAQPLQVVLDITVFDPPEKVFVVA
jgi:hypothetical protein